MSRELTILTGKETVAELSRPEWLRAWERAAAADPKSTWFQEAPFVLSWYRAYTDVYEPVVAIERNGDAITGLLAVGRHRDSGQLVHAGANHAWYHGWISLPEASDFVAEATAELVARYRPAHWRWKFLPPGAGAHWAENAGFGARVSEHRSAVWDLTDPEAISRHESRGLRNYMNRYRREGELHLKQLSDRSEIERALAVLAPWCDLRHGAVHADMPFRDDPCKLPFHQELALSDPSVQTCVLALDDRPLAVHLGAFDGTRLFLGLHGYDPTEGRQSPGTILLLELAAHIREQGGLEIDMTPGGESWKERYASRHREVFRVEIYGAAARRTIDSLGDRLTGLAKGALERIGIAPEDVRSKIGKSPTEPPPAPTVTEIHGSLLEQPDIRPGPAAFDAVDAPWLRELLAYDDHHDRDDTARFLSFALRLLDKGWRPLCATGTRGEPTVAWVQPPDTRACLPDNAERPPRVVRGKLEDSARTVPEDTALVLLTSDAGDDPAHLLPLLMEAARLAGRRRLWVLPYEITSGTRAWLRDHGRRLDAAERAA